MVTQTIEGLTAMLQGLDLAAIPQFEAADVLRQPIDIFHAYLADVLQNLVGCDAQQAYDAIQPANTTGNGDLDIVLPKLKLPGAPDLQNLAADLFPHPHPLFIVPFKDGIHVRFFLSPKVLPRILVPYIIDRGATYGIIDLPKLHSNGNPKHADDGPSQKKVLVEFSSPNLGQSFRTDHLRSTILGCFVANAYEAMGWQAVRINYLGDWGKHIGLLGLGWVRYGSKETLDNHRDPFRYIHEIYVRMEEELKPELAAMKRKSKDNKSDAGDAEAEEGSLIAERDAMFKRLEDGDGEAIELWERLRTVSTAYYAVTYRRLGLNFEDSGGESLVCRNPEALAKVETVLRDKEVSEKKDDGSCIIDFGKHDAARLGTATLRNADGTTTYFLRDVATVMDRLEDYNFDKMIYVVGDQDQHFRQLFKTIELMGHPEVAAKLTHLAFTRGPPQWGDEHILGDILDRCEEYTHRVASDPASSIPTSIQSRVKTLATNSLLLQELNAKNKAHTIGPDPEMLMTTDGETGLSLQIAFAKLCRVIDDLDPPSSMDTTDEPDYSALSDAPWIELLRLLIRFPAVVRTAYKTLEPAGLIAYLFQVVEEVGYCVEEVYDDSEPGQSSASPATDTNRTQAKLFKGARQVLANGMRLLHLVPIS
ncbi:hypothetical protein OQA88_8887 [Cercophora sp. LCS_1]